MLSSNLGNNVAIVGFGQMGRRHLASVGLLGLNIIGIVDSNRLCLDIANKQFGIDRGILFDNLDEMFKARIPDVLIVATTADFHFPITKTAAQRGVKFILTEKPMGVSVCQCREMIQVCKAEGVMLSVNHQMRFMDQYRKIKEISYQEELGGICSMNVVAGNFGIAMNCAHYFEAFRFITDEKILSVSAIFGKDDVPSPRGNRFKDKSGVLRAQTRNGKRLFIDCGADQGNGIFVVYGCRHGQIRLDELSGEYSVMHRKPEDRELPTTRYGMPSHYFGSKIKGAEVVESSALVLDALIKQKEPVTGEDGLHSVKVLAACYRSNAHNGAEVLVDDLDQDGTVFPWA